MDRLDCIKSFARVVETGSFSAVARELNTTQPTVSKQIAALEAYLDVQLLARSTRRLRLTEAGERFYEQCQRLLEAAAEAEASVGQRQKPSGLLRVNCPVAFGQLQLMPRLKGFLDRYPDIKLDLMMSDQFVDLIATGVDLAIRIGTVSDPTLISQRIGLTRRVTIAAKTYFAHHPIPQTPADLVDHNCIVYTRLSTGNEWQFRNPAASSTQTTGTITVVVNGNLQVDNSTAVREAVLSGLGIAVCPIWLLGDRVRSEHLQVILPNYEPTPLPIQAVYRRGRFVPAKVRSFIHYLRDEFKLDPWVSDYGALPEDTAN